MPHERKNMTKLVTTPALIEAGFLSPKIGTKVEFKTFRDGKPLIDRKYKFFKKRSREHTLDILSDAGNTGHAFDRGGAFHLHMSLYNCPLMHLFS